MEATRQVEAGEPPQGNNRGRIRWHVGRIASFLLTGVLVVLAAIALLCWAPRLFGWATFGVVSNSMAPSMWACDLAFADQTVEPEALGVGDVAVFHLSDGKVCGHRVVGVDQQARTLSTKGDAVAIPDAAPVSFDRVIGQVKGSMAFVGAPLLAYQNHKWLCVGIVSIVVAVLFVLSVAFAPPRPNDCNAGEAAGASRKQGRSGQVGNCEKGMGL